ncbi:MAG: recombination regulator RecX [Pseudomonadota bacterium]|nr:recombination regulator RecX [Pseudomonadota bacterium]
MASSSKAMRQNQSQRQATGELARGKPARSLLSRAIALLARRDHSRAELSRKLARYLDQPDDAHQPDDADQLASVLDELDRNGLLSDERFAAAVARSRSNRFGDARIRHDLRRFGVANDVSVAALTTLAGSEVARASEVWSRRFKALPASAAEHAKQARFLQSRGFSFDSILQVLRGRTSSS